MSEEERRYLEGQIDSLAKLGEAARDKQRAEIELLISEMRRELAEERSEFISREDYEKRHDELVRQVESVQMLVKEGIALSRGRSEGLTTTGKIVLGAFSFFGLVLTAIVVFVK